MVCGQISNFSAVTYRQALSSNVDCSQVRCSQVHCSHYKLQTKTLFSWKSQFSIFCLVQFRHCSQPNFRLNMLHLKRIVLETMPLKVRFLARISIGDLRTIIG